MNLSVQDIRGAVLVVSQFTLSADCRKGNRPSFENAEHPPEGKRNVSAIYRRAENNGDYHRGRRFRGLYARPPYQRRPGHNDAGFKEIKTFKAIDILAVID